MGCKAGEPLAFLRSLIDHKGDDCVPWPFSHLAVGYGAIRFEGRTVGAHRVVCTLAHGRPKAGLYAAHFCGNRSCVNPRHIRWATPSENAADKQIHGTQISGERHPFSKLTDDEARLVRQMAADGISHTEIAKRFGMDNSTISGMIRGRHRREAAILAIAPVSAG